MKITIKIISLMLVLVTLSTVAGCGSDDPEKEEQPEVCELIDNGIDKLYRCGNFVMDMYEDYNGNVRQGTAKFVGMNVDVAQGSLEDFSGQTEENYVSVYNGTEITTCGSYYDGKYHYSQAYADKKESLTGTYSDGIYSLSEGMSKTAFAVHEMVDAGFDVSCTTDDDGITTVDFYVTSEVLQNTTYANGDSDLDVKIIFDSDGKITYLSSKMKGTVISVDTNYKFTYMGSDFTVDTGAWETQ